MASVDESWMRSRSSWAVQGLPRSSGGGAGATIQRSLQVRPGGQRLSAGRVGEAWYRLDPSPLFVVDGDGRLLSANPAGEKALESGQLISNGAGVLSFGSSESDTAFLAAVRAVAGKGTRSRLVLRQRHGGWVAAGLHGAPDEALVIVALKEELAPTPEAMSAIGVAFRLTAAELDVLHCLLSGQCPKTVAIHLSISEHTVRAHLRSLYAKMNARGLNSVIRLSCTFL